MDAATLLAWCLILSPWPPPDWLADCPPVAAAAQRIGVDQEWCDADSVLAGYYGGQDGYSRRSAIGELRVARERLADCPHLSDLCRFPNRSVTWPYVCFSRSYQEYCHGQADLYPSWPAAQQQWLRAAAEATVLCDCWNTLDDADWAAINVETRRAALRRLRDELIGPENYAAGRMPPPVPIWRFRSIDH